MEFINLSNGNKMPVMGLGTDDVMFINKPKRFQNEFIDRVSLSFNYRVKKPWLDHRMSLKFAEAIKAGYRHIDTSAAYGNEKSIGDAIKLSGVAREDMFITTRCTNQMQYKGTVKEGFCQSLKRFGLDYIDLYMFHWPVPEHFIDTWRVMEELYDEGLVKNLGFANCHKSHIEKILQVCRIRPVVNQVEVHPLFTQKPLISFCKSEGIQVEAYTPLAKNDDRLKSNKILNQLAKKYGKSRTQVIIRWHIDSGVIPVPRSMNLGRMLQNLDVFDFKLTKAELEDIDSININSRLRYDPDNCDFTIL